MIKTWPNDTDQKQPWNFLKYFSEMICCAYEVKKQGRNGRVLYTAFTLKAQVKSRSLSCQHSHWLLKENEQAFVKKGHHVTGILHSDLWQANEKWFDDVDDNAKGLLNLSTYLVSDSWEEVI